MLFPKKRMMKLANSGEVDFSIPIPYDLEGNTISGGELIDEYNKQQEGALSVSQEFKDDMTPVLTRVLAKRGVGLTDEQYLMYGFGKDFAQKTIIVVGARQTMNEMIGTMKEMTDAYRNSAFAANRTSGNGSNSGNNGNNGNNGSGEYQPEPNNNQPPPSNPPSSGGVSTPASPEGQNYFKDESGGDIGKHSEVDEGLLDLEDRVEMQIDPSSKIKIIKPSNKPPKARPGAPRRKKL